MAGISEKQWDAVMRVDYGGCLHCVIPSKSGGRRKLGRVKGLGKQVGRRGALGFGLDFYSVFLGWAVTGPQNAHLVCSYIMPSLKNQWVCEYGY